jgi:hypothetical protein
MKYYWKKDEENYAHECSGLLITVTIRPGYKTKDRKITKYSAVIGNNYQITAIKGRDEKFIDSDHETYNYF